MTLRSRVDGSKVIQFSIMDEDDARDLQIPQILQPSKFGQLSNFTNSIFNFKQKRGKPSRLAFAFSDESRGRQKKDVIDTKAFRPPHCLFQGLVMSHKNLEILGVLLAQEKDDVLKEYEYGSEIVPMSISADRRLLPSCSLLYSSMQLKTSNDGK